MDSPSKKGFSSEAMAMDTGLIERATHTMMPNFAVTLNWSLFSPLPTNLNISTPNLILFNSFN